MSYSTGERRRRSCSSDSAGPVREVANAGAPLVILAALGAALALADSDGGNAAPAGGDRLDPNVALRVSTSQLAISLERI